MRISRLWYSQTILASMLAAVAPRAGAQAADPPQPGNTGQAASVLSEVVVTAERRKESLEKAAVPVTALSGNDVAAADVSDIVNLTKLVPSVTLQPVAGGSINIYLRGVGTLQANSYAENPIAVNFAGVYIARPSAVEGLLYDLERVEVVKGPQGTLYGRNATGGAVNVLPKRPVLDRAEAEASLEYGNYGTVKSMGAVNLPLGHSAAVRVAGQVVRRNGYQSDGYSDEKSDSARVSLLSDFPANWRAVIVVDYEHLGGKGYGSILEPTAAVPNAPPLAERIGGADPRSIAALTAASPAYAFLINQGLVGVPQGNGYVANRAYGVSATIDHDMGFATLTVIPAWRKTDPDFLSYRPGFLTRTTEGDHQSSIEARLTSNDEQRLRYVAGAYYFTESQATYDYNFLGTLSTAAFNPRLHTDSGAVFGQGSFAVTDTLRLVAGARYTNERRTQSTQLASGSPGNVNPPFGAAYGGRLEFANTTWKGGVEWDAGPHSLVYANVATGFKAGGFYVAAPPNNTFGPEKLTTYTLGTKNVLFGNRLQLNDETFYWNYKGQQIGYLGAIAAGPSSFTVGQVTTNAGDARMYGTEVDARFLATGRDLFGATVQYLDTRYQSFRYLALSTTGAAPLTGCAISGSQAINVAGSPAAREFGVDCAGMPTVNSPKWTANLSYSHTFPLAENFDVQAGASTRIESARFVNIDYTPQENQGSFTMSDAFVTLERLDGEWSVTAYVDNLENAVVINSATTRPIIPATYVSLMPPRTYGVRVGVHF